MKLLLKRLTSQLPVPRRSRAASLMAASILLVTGGVIFYVHNTLSDIERALPLRILEQRQAVGKLERNMAQLRHLLESSSASPRDIERIVRRVDAVDAQLKRIRGTYELDNILGVASLHAAVAPMLFDVRSWLTEGVHGNELSADQTLSLVRTRVSEAHGRVKELVDFADRTASAVLDGESSKIASFRMQMMGVFGILFVVVAALLYYLARINTAQRALDEERQREQLALDAANLYDWEWDVPEQTLHWGRDPTQLLGPGDENGAYPAFPEMVVEEDRESFRKAGRSTLTGDGTIKTQFRINRTDGEIRWLEVQGRRIVNPRGRTDRMIGVIQDITERKQAEQEIHRYAYFDSLTRLPNRQHLVSRLDAAIGRAVDTGRKGALLFMDLDHFKNINDSLGHSVGDQLLRQIADRVCEVVRSSDLVGRLGGDEFTVLLPDLSTSRNECKKIAKRIGEKIQQKLAMPYQVDGHDLQVSASIGISVFPLEECPVETMAGELLKNADTAMYRAKEAGRHTIKFYVDSMQHAASRKLTVQRLIQQALVRDHIRFEFQPQVALNGRVVGVEALLRLGFPDKKGPDTDEIIDVAEESGLVLPLGDWVIVRACRHLKQWAEEGLQLERLSINVSASQFHQNDFVDRVIRVLSETGADPARLEMEITEKTVMINVENAISKMRALKHLGIHFSIDDFGTGYSSLAYLKRLPLDRIKIDQSFTRDVVTDANDAVIVETILSMARSLGLQVIAEGVETAEAFEALKSRRCRVFQGHYFSRPVPESRLAELVRDGLQRNLAEVPRIAEAGNGTT